MAFGFDKSVIFQVQQANDILDVVGEHLSLIKKGREMAGLCPFHDDHKPSMMVSPTKQIFKCFACGAGGDVFKFVQMRENLTFPQAVERLAQRAGIRIEPLKKQHHKPSGEQPADMDPMKLAKINDWAAKHFQKNLFDKDKGKIARDYIAERKISDESVKKWKLGFAATGDDLVKAAVAIKLSPHLLAQAGLAVTGRDGSYADKFVNRLMFTITDVTSRVIGFGGRTLDGADAKYINSPTTVLFDKSNSIYGLEQARHAIVSKDQAVIVEGYTDCMMAHQFGCSNVVATLGTSFTAGHSRILQRYAKQIVLIFDSDAAGTEAANRALEVCLSRHMDIKIASVPQGKDPCDFLLAAGKEAFEKVIANAVEVMQYKWNRLKDSFSSEQTLTGQKTAIEEYLQTISIAFRGGNIEPIERGLIVNRLSKILGMTASQVNMELEKRISRAARSETFAAKNQQVIHFDFGDNLFAKAQQELLEVLLNEPKLFENVKNSRITPDIFDVPQLRQIADLVYETIETEQNVTLQAILAKTESVDVSSCIVELAEKGQQKGNYQPRLDGAIETIKRLKSQQKLSITEVDQKSEAAKNLTDAKKQNPYSLGMR